MKGFGRLCLVLVLSILLQEVNPQSWQKATAATPVLYVAIDGNDTWSGQLSRPKPDGTDGPLATLNGAKDALRRLRTAGLLDSSATVEIQDGVYELASPLELTEQDSGSAEVPVVFRAADGAHPILTGGKQLRGWTVNPSGIWTIEVPEVKSGQWYFSDLYVNGERAVQAQTPNPGSFNSIPKSVDYTVEPYLSEVKNLDFRSFVVRNEDIAPYLALSEVERKDVVVEAFHAWLTTHNYIEKVTDQGDGTSVVTLAGKGYSAPYYDKVTTVDEYGQPDVIGTPVLARRYVLHNLNSGLDQPGEWFLSRTGTLSYRPKAGQDPVTTQIFAPRLDRLVDISGQVDKKAHHIEFRGLSFRHSRYVLPPESTTFHFGRGISSAINVNRAESIVFNRVEVAHTGAYALWCNRLADRCSVTNSTLYDLGGGGIRLGQIDTETGQADIHRKAGAPDPSDNHTVSNTIIRHYGQTYRESYAIHVGYSGQNTLTNNEIAYGYKDGIMIGATISPFPRRTTHITVRGNNIHDIGQGLLSDLGGIHLYGLLPETVVDNNRIYNISRYENGYGAWGIYPDNLTTFVSFTNNLVYNTEEAFKANMVRKNSLVNNIFVNDNTNAQPKILGGGRVAWRGSHRMNEYWGGRGGFVDDHAYLNKEQSYRFVNNIIAVRSDSKLIGASTQWKDDLCSNQTTEAPYCLKTANEFNRNLYFVLGGGNAYFPNETGNGYHGNFETWKGLGYDSESVFADPKFSNISDGNFQLSADSPALALGIKQIDVSQIGPTDNLQKLRLSQDQELNYPAIYLSQSSKAGPTAGQVTYVATVKNLGLSTAYNLQVTIEVPKTASVVNLNNGRLDGRKISWTIDQLTVGETKTLEAVVTGAVE